MKKKFIQKGDNRRNIELGEVQKLQIDPEIPIVGPQGDPQLEIPKDEVHLLYIPPL